MTVIVLAIIFVVAAATLSLSNTGKDKMTAWNEKANNFEDVDFNIILSRSDADNSYTEEYKIEGTKLNSVKQAKLSFSNSLEDLQGDISVNDNEAWIEAGNIFAIMAPLYMGDFDNANYYLQLYKEESAYDMIEHVTLTDYAVPFWSKHYQWFDNLNSISTILLENADFSEKNIKYSTKDNVVTVDIPGQTIIKNLNNLKNAYEDNKDSIYEYFTDSLNRLVKSLPESKNTGNVAIWLNEQNDKFSNMTSEEFADEVYAMVDKVTAYIEKTNANVQVVMSENEDGTITETLILKNNENIWSISLERQESIYNYL
jgi:hypothetical protein